MRRARVKQIALLGAAHQKNAGRALCRWRHGGSSAAAAATRRRICACSGTSRGRAQLCGRHAATSTSSDARTGSRFLE